MNREARRGIRSRRRLRNMIFDIEIFKTIEIFETNG